MPQEIAELETRRLVSDLPSDCRERLENLFKNIGAREVDEEAAEVSQAAVQAEEAGAEEAGAEEALPHRPPRSVRLRSRTRRPASPPPPPPLVPNPPPPPPPPPQPQAEPEAEPARPAEPPGSTLAQLEGRIATLEHLLANASAGNAVRKKAAPTRISVLMRERERFRRRR